MYDHIYPAIVTSGIAIELEEEQMVTLQGTIAEDPTKSYGRKTRYYLTRLDLLFSLTRLVQIPLRRRMEVMVAKHLWCTKLKGHSLDPLMWTAISLF